MLEFLIAIILGLTHGWTWFLIAIFIMCCVDRLIPNSTTKEE